MALRRLRPIRKMRLQDAEASEDDATELVELEEQSGAGLERRKKEEVNAPEVDALKVDAPEVDAPEVDASGSASRRKKARKIRKKLKIGK